MCRELIIDDQEVNLMLFRGAGCTCLLRPNEDDSGVAKTFEALGRNVYSALEDAMKDVEFDDFASVVVKMRK